MKEGPNMGGRKDLDMIAEMEEIKKFILDFFPYFPFQYLLSGHFVWSTQALGYMETAINLLHIMHTHTRGFTVESEVRRDHTDELSAYRSAAAIITFS